MRMWQKYSGGLSGTAPVILQMSLFKKEKNAVGSYTDKDYKKALKELDPEPDDDFFGKKSFSESGSTVMALIKGIIYIAFVIVSACFLAYFAISFVNDVFAFVKEDTDIEVTIPEYVTADELAEILGDAGVIKHPGVFRIYAKLKHIDEKEVKYKFVAGTYTVNSNMNYDNLFLSFVEKKIITTIRVTIPEGYTVDDIINLFLSKNVGTKDGWVDAVNNYDFGEEYSFIYDIPEKEGRIYRLEGYLFPDTYEFYTGKSEDYYIRRMLDRFNEIFSEKMRKACQAQGRTIDEVLAVASVIQKEAYYPSDYELVAQVIWNRLADGSQINKLECESTVVYAASHAQGKKITEVTSELLNFESAYNSFLHSGIIPSPICNPSTDAISTAINPGTSTTPLYYFVTDNEKFVRAAATIKEHQQNIEDIKKEAAQAH